MLATPSSSLQDRYAIDREYRTRHDTSHPNWDVAPDGCILMLKRAGDESQAIMVHIGHHQPPPMRQLE